MIDEINYKIRLTVKDDEPFLFEMLFQSLFVENGEKAFLRAVLKKPEIARYVKNWGRRGDLGFIAETAETGEKIGAAWCRLPNGGDKGFAYLDDETPELGIALLPEFRGKGVGTALMKRLSEAASQNYPAICLSVSPNNPAMRLYEKLGFKTVDVRNDHPVMRLEFKKS